MAIFTKASNNTRDMNTKTTPKKAAAKHHNPVFAMRVRNRLKSLTEFILHFLTETTCPSPRTDTRQKDRAILPARSRESVHSHVRDMRRAYGQRGEKVFFFFFREDAWVTQTLAILHTLGDC